MSSMTYKGVEIALDASNKFRPKGFDRGYDSYALACDAITRHLAASKDPLKLPAITSGGTKITITGIHDTNGTLLTKPKPKYRHDEIYVDSPIVAELLHEAGVLEAQLDAANTKLDSLRLDRYGHWHRGDDYQTKIVALKETHAAAVAAAAEMIRKRVKPRRKK